MSVGKIIYTKWEQTENISKVIWSFFFIYSFQKSQIKCAVFSLESENTHPPYSTAHYTVHIDVCKSTKTYGNILI